MCPGVLNSTPRKDDGVTVFAMTCLFLGHIFNKYKRYWCHFKAVILLHTCVRFCSVILNSRGVTIILVCQSLGGGGGGGGSCSGGSLCTNSTGEVQFLISIEKLGYIFINSLPTMNLVPK